MKIGYSEEAAGFPKSFSIRSWNCPQKKMYIGRGKNFLFFLKVVLKRRGKNGRNLREQYSLMGNRKSG